MKAAADPTVPRNSRRSIVSCFFFISLGPRVSGIGQRTSATGRPVNHINSERGLLARSENRVGLSALTSNDEATPSQMISDRSWPSAGECITPWPDDPLARNIFSHHGETPRIAWLSGDISYNPA